MSFEITRGRRSGGGGTRPDGGRRAACPGQDSWRDTRRNARPRGVFCGIGVCFDCLVVVNGVPDVRACQRTVAPGDDIRTQHGAELPGAAGVAERRGSWWSGPGRRGWRLRSAAADAGAPVLLLDSAAGPGGQYYRQPGRSGARTPSRLTLQDRLTSHPDITHLPDTSVWALEPADGSHLLRLQTGAGRRARANRQDRGGRGAGAGDRRVRPGAAVPGLGPARRLHRRRRAGAGQGTAGSRSGSGCWSPGPGRSCCRSPPRWSAQARRSPACWRRTAPTAIGRTWLGRPTVAARKLGELASYGAVLARHRIAVRYRTAVIAAHGTDRVEAVTTARLDLDWNPVPGTRREVAVDAVCVGFGFTAQLELAVSARCDPHLRTRRGSVRSSSTPTSGPRCPACTPRASSPASAVPVRPRPRVPWPAPPRHTSSGTAPDRPARSDSWLLVATVWPPPWPRRTRSATAGGAGSPATRWSAGARRSRTASCARPSRTARRHRAARGQADQPSRPRSVPGPGLRPQHRRAARRTSSTTPRPPAGRSPYRSGWATWPEPRWRNSDREARRRDRRRRPAVRRGRDRTRRDCAPTWTGTPSTAAGWSRTAAAASGRTARSASTPR